MHTHVLSQYMQSFKRFISLKAIAKDLGRHLLIVSYPLLEVCTMLYVAGDLHIRLFDQWKETYALQTFCRQLEAGLLPVPFVFPLWLRLLERDDKIPVRFSPIMATVSLCCFAYTLSLDGHPYVIMLVYTLAVVAGLFVFLPIREWFRRAAKQPRLACTALLAATASWNYYWVMQHTITRDLLYASGTTAALGIQLLGIETLLVPNMERFWAYDLYSSRYAVIMSPYCSGFEGMFLFTFMLSVVALLDWDRLNRMRLWPMYVLGEAALFVINSLRVGAIFALGHWAHSPSPSDWVLAYRDSGIDLFHSWLGWVLDLVAFGLFITWFYRSSVKSHRPAAE